MSDQTLPKLPPGWARVRLDEIADVRLGRQRSPSTHQGENMVPYLRAANITWAGVNIGDVKTMHFEPEEAASYRLQDGDVLLSEASGSPSEVGKPAVWRGQLDGDVCFQNTLLRVRPAAGVDSQYLQLRLLHEAKSGRFAAAARGVGIHHLTAKKLCELMIDLPPAAEQRRIAAALDELASQGGVARAGLDKLRRLLASLECAVLRSAAEGGLVNWSASGGARFALPSDPNRRRPPAQAVPVKRALLPEGWIVHSLDELTDPARKAAYGVLQPGGHVEKGIPLVRVGDIGAGTVQTTGLKRISPEVAERYPRTCLRGGELLLTLVGTVGRTAVAPSTLRGANVARAVGVIPLTHAVNIDFVALVLQAEPYASALVSRSHEVARKTLNLEDVRAFPVPLPPRPLQDMIVTEAHRQLSVIRAARAGLEQLERRVDGFWRACLAAACGGQLVLQDPNDEPAGLLLEQIAAQRAAARLTAGRRPRRKVSADAHDVNPREATA